MPEPAEKPSLEYLSTAALPIYFGSTYGACKLYNCLAGTSKAVIHTDTDVLTEDIEQQPWALLEEDYLIPIQVMAVDFDRRCTEWRKRQEHWQVLFVAGCRLLLFLLLFWQTVYVRTLQSSRCSCFVIFSVSTRLIALDFTSFIVVGCQAGLSTCCPSAAERPTRAAS